ncbi:MAG: hypothetical protein ACOCYZ_01310 [Halococcoides sp.]
MATAVKLDDPAKDRLEELQAEIRLKTGQSVTQQELLSRIIDDAYDTRDDIVDSFRDSEVPLSDEQLAALGESRISSGVETDEDDIDDVLYG